MGSNSPITKGLSPWAIATPYLPDRPFNLPYLTSKCHHSTIVVFCQAALPRIERNNS